MIVYGVFAALFERDAADQTEQDVRTRGQLTMIPPAQKRKAARRRPSALPSDLAYATGACALSLRRNAA
jgi:hypothetical protein